MELGGILVYDANAKITGATSDYYNDNDQSRRPKVNPYILFTKE